MQRRNKVISTAGYDFKLTLRLVRNCALERVILDPRDLSCRRKTPRRTGCPGQAGA